MRIFGFAEDIPDRSPSLVEGPSMESKMQANLRLRSLIRIFAETDAMNKIEHFEHIFEYNDLLGVATLHPLVSVIDLSTARRIRRMRHTFGFYALFLKEVKCGNLIYGRQHYDYQEGTIVAIAPGQVAGVEDDGGLFQPKGLALVFHPDLIRGSSLGRHIRDYSFFSYEANEALHLSEQERDIVVDCFRKIRIETEHAIDKHTRRLITANIELLLDYCVRFYERQFITRSNVNNDILSRFEAFLDEYFASDKLSAEGLPSVRHSAGQLHLSPNYFGDLIKKETGRTAQEHIRLRLIDMAKERILDDRKSVSQVAYELGFKYPQHFTRLFKKVTGLTPKEYRTAN